MTNHASQSAGWQVEQSASEAYEQYLVPPMFAPLADRKIETSGVNEGDRVLDVARDRYRGTACCVPGE